MAEQNQKYLHALALLPKNILSSLLGNLADLPLPETVVNFFITIFRRYYKIDMTEVAESSFKTWNDFFTRRLRLDCRPIAEGSIKIVSPVDGVVGCFGKIDRNTLFQAKGIPYSLNNLLVNPKYAKLFQNGYYITFYLSPRHYHRIHSPLQGTIEELLYIPGTLYPVNACGVEHIPGIFTLNERLITFLRNEFAGLVAVVKIGATVVGKIKVVYDQIESNRERFSISRKYSGLLIRKGEELGRFQMGSTVILFFEPGKIMFYSLQLGQEIRFGEAIGEAIAEGV
jgi:phosphatidylserine decarboxylase